jgi:F420-0:gamma-glutamyl ligase
MNVTRELASFANLPDVPKPTWAVISNADGEFIKESKITPTYNAMDIHRLPKGMYFVTLVYRNKNQKAFVLNVTE